MSKVQVNSGLIGKKVTLLGGTVTKIVDVGSKGYKLDGIRKMLSAWQLTKQGGKLVQVESDVKKSDVTDSGHGYGIVAAKDKKAKADKVEPSDKKGKKEKSVKKEKAPEPSKSSKKQKAVEVDVDDYEEEAAATTLTKLDGAAAKNIRATVMSSVNQSLSRQYDNFMPSETASTGQFDDTGKYVVTLGLTFDLPQEEEKAFEFSKTVQRSVNPGFWEKVKANKPEVIEKIESNLDIVGEEYTLEIGSCLVDEKGNAFFFAGVSTDKKHFVLQDEDGNPVLITIADFKLYDLSTPADEGDDLGLDDEDEGDDLGLDDEDEGDDEDDVESETEDQLADLDEKQLRRALKNMSRLDMEAHLNTFFTLDEETQAELPEMSDSELRDFLVNTYLSEEDEEEEEDGDEEEASLDDMDLDQLLDLAEANEILVPRKIQKAGEEAVREFLAEQFGEEDDADDTDEDEGDDLLADDDSDDDDSDDDDSDEGDDDEGDDDDLLEEEEEEETSWTEEQIRDLDLDEAIDVAKENGLKLDRAWVKFRKLKKIHKFLIAELVDADEEDDEGVDDEFEFDN